MEVSNNEFFRPQSPKLPESIAFFLNKGNNRFITDFQFPVAKKKDGLEKYSICLS